MSPFRCVRRIASNVRSRPDPIRPGAAPTWSARIARMNWADLLHATADHAAGYLETVDERPVARPVEPQALRDRLPRDLPEAPADPRSVLDELVSAVDPGLVASAGPRYFGFVTGGSV